MGLKSHQVNVQRMLPKQVLAGSVAAHILTQTVKSLKKKKNAGTDIPPNQAQRSFGHVPSVRFQF